MRKLLHIYVTLSSHQTHCGHKYCYDHFTDEAMEAQTFRALDKVTCPINQKARI